MATRKSLIYFIWLNLLNKPNSGAVSPRKFRVAVMVKEPEWEGKPKKI